MDEVTVNKAVLIAKLTTNKEAHTQLYKDALEGYFVEVQKKLQKELAKAKANKKIIGFSFTIPADHTKQYAEAITMLEMSVDKEITLTQREFKMYVLDDWISTHERSVLRGLAMSSSNAGNYTVTESEEEE